MIAGTGLSTRADPLRAAIAAAREAAAKVPEAERRLALVFAAGAAAADGVTVCEAVREITGAPLLAGAAAAGVSTEAGEADEGVAVALIGGTAAHCSRARGLERDAGGAASRLLGDLDLEASGLLLALLGLPADPAPVLAAFTRQAPTGLALVGAGLAPGAWTVAGGPEEAAEDDACAAVWLPGAACTWGLSAALRPVAGPLAVTAAAGGLLAALGGRPALTVAREALGAARGESPERTISRLFLGLPDPEAGWRAYPLLGANPAAAALAVGGLALQPGQEVALLARDPAFARSTLQALAARLAAELARPPRLAVWVQSAGRGRELHGDAEGAEIASIAAALPGVPLIGLRSNAELTASSVHLYQGALALLA